jgi:hypothetical protein
MNFYKIFLCSLGLLLFSSNQIVFSQEISITQAASVDTQVKIAMEDRVPNKTGIQCVWSSIETIARHQKIEVLYDITEDSRYKGFAGPTSAAKMLDLKKVKFEQTYPGSKRDTRLLIQGCQRDKTGVAFGVPGHMMTMVHYDEVDKVVQYIDNSDKTLTVRTWTLSEFNRRWDGWSLVIYPNDTKLKIVDMNNNQSSYKEGYVIKPKVTRNN